MAERALAHVEQIVDIQPIQGADRIEVATVLGWKVVVKKNEFKVGDKIVYIEIDSKVPADNPYFEFLKNRNYKVKTIKLRKQISQGLIVPLSLVKGDYAVGTDVTDELGITYIQDVDNKRKKNVTAMKTSVYARFPWIKTNPITKYLMTKEWGRTLIFALAGENKNPRKFPSWVVKTDETRIQNAPFYLQMKKPIVVTEKIDGTSTTFTVMRKSFGRFEYHVCSRNVDFQSDEKCFYKTNVYLEMGEKYSVKDKLVAFLKAHPKVKYVTLQGETFGEGVQKRFYGLKGRDFRGFNFITSDRGRWGTVEAANYWQKNGIPWVPIIDTDFILPDTVDELIAYATRKSQIDGQLAEGCVFRTPDGQISFKAVSNEYLLSKWSE